MARPRGTHVEAPPLGGGSIAPWTPESARVRRLAEHTAAADSWPAEQVEAAQRLAARLTHLAVLVVADGTIEPCGSPGCPLDDSTGHGAPRLAHQLAAVGGAQNDHDMSSAAGVEADPDPRSTHRRFRDALRDASAVVYCCRRVLHQAGGCFFDPSGPSSSLCGRVLAVSHQVEHGVVSLGRSI